MEIMAPLAHNLEPEPKNEGLSIRPERLEGESFEDYKARRKVVNEYIKSYLKHGVPFWDSTKGTYTKKR